MRLRSPFACSARKRLGHPGAPAGRRAGRSLALFALALLGGCRPAASPCTGPEALERSLSSLGARRWESVVEREALAAWPSPLVREEAAVAVGSDGTAQPYALWLRKEREDRRGCVCCQAIELGPGAGEPLVLHVVSLHVFAPTWAEASRTASRLVLVGIPPHVSSRLAIPAAAPATAALPWETAASWTSDPDPQGRFTSGTALVQIDSAPGGWVVLVRHQRPAPRLR